MREVALALRFYRWC